MTEFLQAIISLPTGLFTVPLGLALLYWLFVMIGAADVDLLGGADGQDARLRRVDDGGEFLDPVHTPV